MHPRLTIVRLLPVLDFGGVESRVVLQSELVDRQRFDLRVCTFWRDGSAAREVRKLGIPVDVLDVDPSVRNPRATLALTHYLWRTRPDILHASISEGIFHGAIAGTLAGIPVRIVEEVGIPERGELGSAIFGLAYQLAHAVIGVSKATCDIIYGEGAPADRLHLVYNCASPTFFQPGRQRTEHHGPLRILAVGRLVPVKNHAMLLHAMRRVVDRAPGVTLRIAGEGPLRDETAQLIEDLKLDENVELLGFRDDVRDLLYHADVFVLPSVTEGCSISLVEAMATGICVVGSTADGILEVMGDVGDEWLVPHDDIETWADALLELDSMKPEVRIALGDSARRIAYERFSPETYDDTLTGLYEALAAKHLQ